MNEILQLDATGQAELVQKGEITPSELVELSIQAIKKHNPTLNAVITPMFDEAREEAAQNKNSTPFNGVPMLLKDGIASYQGVRFSSGSDLFKNNIGRYDSKIVKRYKRAGFVIVGKANLPEFGLLPTTEPTAFGATHNPWDLTKTPGGSSGGSCAAVAARLVPAAHSNDGGGSIRIPASCCGLFGLKPTRARNPLGPLSSLVSGLVEEHVVTRSVRDSAAILDITSEIDPFAFYQAPHQTKPFTEVLKEPVRKLKIGYSLTQLSGKAVHKDCIEATQKTIDLCKALGHDVEEMPLKVMFAGKDLSKELGPIFSALWAVGATSPLAAYERTTKQLPPKDLVEPLTYALYEIGKKMSGFDYELARQRMHQVARSVNKFFRNIDIWISPTLAMPPVDLGYIKQNPNNPLEPMAKAAEFAPMTAIFNISGQPAASLPMYWNNKGLPIGVQLVGRFGDEATIFQLSQQLENEVKWQEILPEMLEA